MDAFLSKITQHAMNYAIRSGIGITASFAISQTTRLLKTVDDNGDYQELQHLQERLDSKIRIISPAIDLIELISARGNTTLESAVTLAKDLRWDIQSLGIRLEKAAAAEETSRKKSGRAKSRASHEVAIRQIVQDIRKVLIRIEDAVPLINLAIATSGASLSTRLPSTVSPSRLLQASTFLTLGDTRYCENPGVPAQIGPTFTLSLYMLYGGHAPVERKEKSKGEEKEPDKDTRHEPNRGPTWKEVIHKARVKLLRIPLDSMDSTSLDGHTESVRGYGGEQTITSAGRTTEFAYELEFIEDLDDDRLHTFEDSEPQPGPYGGVQLAGIRESLPIHQIARIFYADTGKILNLKSQHETNNPVLLLKRDIDALPPRRFMQESEKSHQWYENPEETHHQYLSHDSDSDSQNDIDRQIHRESSVALLEQAAAETQQPEEESRAWRFPQDLDPEWIALEVYTEPEEPSSDDEQEPSENTSFNSRQPSLSAEAESPSDKDLVEKLEAVNLSEESRSPTPTSSPKSTPPPAGVTDPIPESPFLQSPNTAAPSTPFGPIRSSLSLMEMLIRLSSLQQFQQASHLSIPDEFLVFFLEESSSTGLGGADDRRNARNAAREKVGFDPYDETPLKRPGEEYSGGGNQWDTAPAQPTYSEYERSPNYYDNRGFHNTTPNRWTPPPRLEGGRRAPGTPEPRLPFSSNVRPAQEIQDIPPSSPVSPYRPVRKLTRQLQRVKQSATVASPLGRGVSVETDSTLGTSPGSPTLLARGETVPKKVHEKKGTESELVGEGEDI